MLRLLYQISCFIPLVVSIQKTYNSSIHLYFFENATSYPIRDGFALGLSFEFFQFPAYMQLKQTSQCLSNLESAYGAPTSIRIGGTSQDYAIFDPNQKEAIYYPKYQPRERFPHTISYGPDFIRLASTLPGATTLGLNRRMDNVSNVAAVTAMAIKEMKNLYAIELGNEPEFWGSHAPVAHGKPWTPEADAESQLNMQEILSEKVDKEGLIQAGVFLSPPSWSIHELAPKVEKNSKYIKSFGLHAYPQTACRHAKTNLTALMLHSSIVKFVQHFKPEVDAADKLDKPFHFSETNSATCSGGEISNTFGASLWLMDYVFQSLILGVHRIYFHQATINASPYSFWNRDQVAAPYYGAYFTALALQNASHINILQTSDPLVAAYALYRCLKIIRIVVYHSGLYSGKTEEKSQTLRLPGLPPRITSARLLRLTARDALVKETGQDGPQIGKSHFDNNSCKLSASPQYETADLNEGILHFDLRPSEAVIIEFNEGVITTCPNGIWKNKKPTD